jgi:uncharacterized membrane protein YfcA
LWNVLLYVSWYINEMNTLQLLKWVFVLVCLVVAFRMTYGESIKKERHTLQWDSSTYTYISYVYAHQQLLVTNCSTKSLLFETTVIYSFFIEIIFSCLWSVNLDHKMFQWSLHFNVSIYVRNTKDFHLL